MNFCNPTKKTKTAITCALTIGTLALSGCSLSQRVAQSAHKYWIEETGIAPAEKTYDHTEYNSNRPEDYILANGKGIAIPSKVEFDLYISPFAPSNGYVQSKKPPGSEVICPYSGKILILGEREYVAEKEL